MINVSNNFHSAAFGQVIEPIVKLYISFDKNLSEGGFFTLEQSELNGPDLLKFAALDADTQSWDFYDYIDYSDRLVSVSWQRSLEFPYQVQAGMIDFTLSNTDGFFTPLNPHSSIGANNLPTRPIKLSAGLQYPGATEMVPQMSGITEGLPTLNQDSHTVDYHAIDFLYDISSKSIKKAISMRDARTDLVIAALLQDYGLSPTQYNLEHGRYKVPFVFFDTGATIGDALKKLVQSENGFMWLDEAGVIRFATSAATASDTEVVATLSDYDIISLAPGELSDVVNHVLITAECREVQEWQEVYTKTSSMPSGTSSGSSGVSQQWVVGANGGTFTISCGLGDPCYDVVTPTIGRASSVSWFTAFDLTNFQSVPRGITAEGVLTSNAYEITFTNRNPYAVEIDELKLWGEPAKVFDVIDYEAYDDESVEKYGDQRLEISDNQFFQSYSQANAFARTIIKEHSDYTRTVKAEIKGDFSFQLMDMIEIQTTGGDYDGIYRILGTSYSWNGRELTTTLTLNGTSIIPGMFTLNLSQLNGKDLLG